MCLEKNFFPVNVEIDLERNGDWMQTYTGRKFWPLDPRPEDFDIEDIAHSLSMNCRYNGHCIKFYSVAEHSCHLFDAFQSKEDKKWAILHDAPEAYVSDIVSPLKRDMPEFQKIENRIMSAIVVRWKLEGKVIPINVHWADKAIVRDELANMRDVPAEWNIPRFGIRAQIQCWWPEKAKAEFLDRCTRIGID